MTEKFVVTGMTCAACAAHVEKAASSLDGVDSAAVNLRLGTLVCAHDVDRGSPQASSTAATRQLMNTQMPNSSSGESMA